MKKKITKDADGKITVEVTRKVKKVVGQKGDTGATGPTGPKGAEGKSIRGDQGKTGPQGKNYDNSIEHTVKQNKRDISAGKKETDKRCENIAVINKGLREDLLTLNDNITIHVGDTEVHFDNIEQKEKFIELLERDFSTTIISGGGSPEHNLLIRLDGGQDAPKQYYHLTESDYNDIVNDAFLFRDGHLPMTGDLDMDNNVINNVGHIQFDLEHPESEHSEGNMHWNIDDGTLEFGLPGGYVNLQIGQETLLPRRIKNISGSDMKNGELIYITGGDGNNSYIALAKADTEETSASTIAMLTEDIDNNQFGYATVSGLVRGETAQPIDTSAYTEGTILYLSPDIAGGFTDVRPDAPDHMVNIGQVFRRHATEGQVSVRIINGFEITELHDVYAPAPQDRDALSWNSDNDRYENARFVDRDLLNGTFREAFDCRATSDGVTITATLQNSNFPTNNILTAQFSDGDLEYTTPLTVELTEGSDTSPQINYVYIPFSTKVLTVSTSNWPDEEYVEVCFFFLTTALQIQSQGPFITQNTNNELSDDNNMGHVAHMGQKLRRGLKGYFSGLDANGQDQDTNSSYFNYISASESYFKYSSGIMYQMHKQVLPAKDTELDENDIHVVNWNGNNYMEISQLNDIIADSEGNSLSNKYFNLFFFAVGNKTGEYSPIMCQLPSGSYVSKTSAENDVDGFDNLFMPREFHLDSSVGVPICRLTLRYSGGTSTLTHISTTDLRTSTIGAGAGSTGGSTHFIDNQFSIANVTDITKILDFDISSVATGTTRTITAPNFDLDLSTPIFDSLQVGSNILLEADGQGTFTSGSSVVTILDVSRAGFFDWAAGTNTVTLANGTYAIDASGDCNIDGDLTIDGSAQLGDASTDIHGINTAPVAGSALTLSYVDSIDIVTGIDISVNSTGVGGSTYGIKTIADYSSATFFSDMYGIHASAINTGGHFSSDTFGGWFSASGANGAGNNWGIWVDAGNAHFADDVNIDGDLTIDGSLNHDGTDVGFYGTAPIAQAVLATGAGATVDNVITALQNLGLVKQA